MSACFIYLQNKNFLSASRQIRDKFPWENCLNSRYWNENLQGSVLSKQILLRRTRDCRTTPYRYDYKRERDVFSYQLPALLMGHMMRYPCKESEIIEKRKIGTIAYSNSSHRKCVYIVSVPQKLIFSDRETFVSMSQIIFQTLPFLSQGQYIQCTKCTKTLCKKTWLFLLRSLNNVTKLDGFFRETNTPKFY